MESYLQKHLNSQQYQAATFIDSASLILAGAGSWKTRTLTYKIAYMIHKGINPNNILAVTFTNKAANEMKERLETIFSNIKNKDFNQSDDFDDIISATVNKPVNLSFKTLNRIWTFHSIFLKILKEDIIYLNDILGRNYNKYFNIYDETDSIKLIKDIIKQLWVKDTISHKEAKWYISRAKNNWLVAEKFLYSIKKDSEEIIWKIYQQYEKQLASLNALDFDDLLLLPYILFRKNKQILEKWKNKFKYILVDEAQDTNKIQFDLIYMLSGADGNITLIWDDFQSIYWWRWAVIQDFLNAKKYWPNIKIFKLETNYRSNKTIVQAWNHIIKNNKNQFSKNLKSYTDKENKIKIIRFDNDIDESVQVINLIRKIKNKKNKKWSDFAILYRMNAQSQPFEQILLTENIPYKIWWWFKFYERKEIKDIIAYIKYIINPSDIISCERIINVPNRKIWTATVNKLKAYSIENNITFSEIFDNIDNISIIWTAAKNNLKTFINTIKFLKLNLEWMKITDFIMSIVNHIKYEEYLIKTFWEEEAKERMANIGQLVNTATSITKKWLEGLTEFIDQISLMIDLEESQTQTKDAIQLMTVHASKWLEFDTVFVVWLEENIFPMSRARLNPSELEEERRLMYVAITRAKNNLILTYADSRMQYGSTRYNSVSRFVEEIPQQLTIQYNTTWTTKQNMFNIQDRVYHKLFGYGEIIEVFDKEIIVKFDSWQLKRIDARFLERK